MKNSQTSYTHQVLLDASNHFWDAAWVLARQWDAQSPPISIKQIARWLNTSASTVKYNLARDMPSLRPNATPPGVSPSKSQAIEDRRALVSKLVMETKVTHRGPRRKYPSALHISRAINLDATNAITASKCCVQRDLNALGFRSLKRQRGPKRVVGDHANRMKICKQLLRKKHELHLACFSDGKFFDSNDHGADREWCPPGVQPSHRERDTWAPRVHVWGVIGVNVKFLVRLKDGRLTAETYKRQCLYPLVAYLKAQGIPHSKIIFQLDGETAMNAGVCRTYLEEKGIKVFERWPARSPDLSPIENCWAIIQRRVDSHGPEDIEALWRFVKQEWDAIEAKEVSALVDSFIRRCQRCIAVGGGTITTKFNKKDRQ